MHCTLRYLKGYGQNWDVKLVYEHFLSSSLLWDEVCHQILHYDIVNCGILTETCSESGSMYLWMCLVAPCTDFRLYIPIYIQQDATLHSLFISGNRSTCRSQWPRGLRHRSVAARQLRLRVRIPPGALMFVCCECCVLSGGGLCDELITRPEESYRLWCVVVCVI